MIDRDKVKRAREALDDSTLPVLLPSRVWDRVLADVATALREAEQRGMLLEREGWQKWLGETRVHAAEQSFDVETAIACGGKELTLHDAGQAGYAAAIFVWERAVKEQQAAIERAAKET